MANIDNYNLYDRHTHIHPYRHGNSSTDPSVKICQREENNAIFLVLPFVSYTDILGVIFFKEAKTVAMKFLSKKVRKV